MRNAASQGVVALCVAHDNGDRAKCNNLFNMITDAQMYIQTIWLNFIKGLE
jgi:hypothetical protein